MHAVNTNWCKNKNSCKTVALFARSILFLSYSPLVYSSPCLANVISCSYIFWFDSAQKQWYTTHFVYSSHTFWCCYWFWSYDFHDWNEQQLIFEFYKMEFRFIFDFVHWIYICILSIFRWVFSKNTSNIMFTLTDFWFTEGKNK